MIAKYIFPPEIDKTILSVAEIELLEELWEGFLILLAPEVDRERFIIALINAYLQHAKTSRKSGESYFLHDLRCSIKAMANGCELKIVSTMLCHEFKEDNNWLDWLLRVMFGSEIARYVIALSKIKKNPNITRLERIEIHIATMIAAIVFGFWIVLLCKIIDRHDNIHDTAGLNKEALSQLFGETRNIFLPFFYEYLCYIPPLYRRFCEDMLSDIKNACRKYERSLEGSNSTPYI